MKTETGLSIAFLLAIIFRLLHLPGSGMLLVLSLSTLAIIYFPAGFYFLSDSQIKKAYLPLSIIGGFFLSTMVIGILFKLQYWPGYEMYLQIGIFAGPLLLAITYWFLRKATKESETYFKNMIVRTSIVSILTILLYLTPTATLLRIQYYDDPELARLKTLHYTHPYNEQYKRQHDAYLLQRDSL